ncbi:MAG: hypothetical protein QF898_00490 [SAR202 cluster bacterium]|jgi:hypothetical protein|nr:hypothetical protein [SAR202 cluster bacterium]MDP6514419.1 hypothetical protein [SAR202 cluster bacterium]
MIELNRIRKARGFLHLGKNDGYDLVIESFSILSEELQARAVKAREHADAPSPYVPIAAATHFVTAKLMDLLARFEMVDWMAEELSQLSDRENIQRQIYLGLAIKDFHVDVFSLLDPLASALSLVSSGLNAETNRRLPGWTAIQSRKSGGVGIHRQNLADDLCQFVDSTDRWLPTVTQIRDILIHRDRLKLIVGDPTDGILFQMPGWTRTRPVLQPVLLHPERPDVVDFELYSAFVVAEILALLNELGQQMAKRLGMKLRAQPLSMRYGNYKGPARGMDRLQRLLQTPSD